jgi:hypothetical protein
LDSDSDFVTVTGSTAEAATAAAAAAGLGSVTRRQLRRCSREQFVIQMTKTITIIDNIKTKTFNNSNNKTDYNTDCSI